MGYLVVLFIGLVLGVFIMSLACISEFNDLVDEINRKIDLKKNADKFIERLSQKNNCLYEEKEKLMIENQELRDKIVDLENNLEFVVNNCENDKIKELVTDSQSEN